MSYGLEAFLGPPDILRAARAKLVAARFVPLRVPDLGLIPLTPELLKELHGSVPGKGEWAPGFQGLSVRAAAWVAEVSRGTSLAYVEADVADDFQHRDQAGAVWRDGALSWGPARAPDAINQTLAELGIKKAGYDDEFDTVGLGMHRWTQTWPKDEKAE